MKPDPAGLPTSWEAAEEEVSEPAQSAVPASRPADSAGSLLDAIVGVSHRDALPRIDRLERFLAASKPSQALGLWLGRVESLDREQLVRRLSRDVAQIDRLLNDQLNAILHHPRFQRLEASWRGLHYLTRHASADEHGQLKIRVLNVTWTELERDFDHALEFDQSQLFRKVYEQEFGMAGGKPFGVLIADYEIHPVTHAQHRHDDLNVLRSLSEVGAAAFCPVIANASPAMLGMDDFRHLETTIDHARTFDQAAFLRWKSLRDTADTRYVALTLPHILMRRPYQDDGTRVDRFVFREDVSGPDASKYLWGGAAFALGGVVMRAFAESGWLADIRGVRRGEEGGGLVIDLPSYCFSTDRIGVAPKASTDVIVREDLERELSDLGFLPLCHCPDTHYSAFYSSQSVQKPKKFDRPAASINARISSMLQYMLCASRFAHYLKVLGRDRVGSVNDPNELQRFLHDWIHQYVVADSDAGQEVKAKYPLREARIRVDRDPAKPGSFRCTMHLAPHYQLDEMVANVRLVTTLAPGSKP